MTIFSSKTAFLVAICLLSYACAEDETEEGMDYGADVSWPMHETAVSTNYPWLSHNVDPSIETPEEYEDMVLQPLGNVQDRYERFMAGCFNHYEVEGKGYLCHESEEARIDRINEQPKSMLYFTEDAFSHFQVPEHVASLLKNFWDTNSDKIQLETSWPKGDTHANYWASPTYLLPLAQESLPGGGYALDQHVINEVRAVLEEWTGQRLVETGIYGIRVYTSGSILAPHLESHPYVASAIINVAQDLDEPWPFELIDHDGVAHNVTLAPGEMVLYESHTVIHGHPFHLEGRFAANIFVHFEPIGPIDEPIDFDRSIPPHIDPESEAAQAFLAEHPNGYLKELLERPNVETHAHHFASHGDVKGLTEVLKESEEAVGDRDENSWTPFARAVRNGHEAAVQFLMDRGSDHHAILGSLGESGSILWNAIEDLGEDHSVVQLLKQRGAREVEPLGMEEL